MVQCHVRVPFSTDTAPFVDSLSSGGTDCDDSDPSGSNAFDAIVMGLLQR